MWNLVPLGAVGIHASTLDYAILAVYFLVVLGIGAVAKLTIKTERDAGAGLGPDPAGARHLRPLDSVVS